MYAIIAAETEAHMTWIALLLLIAERTLDKGRKEIS